MRHDAIMISWAALLIFVLFNCSLISGILAERVSCEEDVFLEVGWVTVVESHLVLAVLAFVKGNQGCAGQFGSTHIPEALSSCIFFNTSGMRLNGGKA